MEPTRKQPLFIVTGASGVGKTTLCEVLFQNETDYLVMESDLLWNSSFDTPEDNYREYRRLWLRMCASISQIGKPVVLCGAGIPEQFENLPERVYFTELHYLAAVCDDKSLEQRMRDGRGIQDEGWIQSSMQFNRWLQENAEKNRPPITLLDTSCLTAQEAAVIADQWIRERM